MSMIRVENKTKGFSVIDNTPFEDKMLSWSAKGLMGYLLTKPDSWHVRMEDLYKSSPQGEHATRNIVKELIEKGYIVRDRVKGKRGRFEWEYVVFEKPTIWHFSIDGASIDGTSACGEVPHIVSTNRVNTELTYTVGQSPLGVCLSEEEKEAKRRELCRHTEPDQPTPLKAEIKTEKTPSAPKKAKTVDPMIKQVMDYLIEKSGKNLQPDSASAKKYIPQRLKDGNQWPQFKAVIDYKVQEWNEEGKEINGKPASFYLRPETLFTTENFPKYLEEAREAYRLAQKKPKAVKVQTVTNSIEDHRKLWGGE